MVVNADREEIFSDDSMSNKVVICRIRTRNRRSIGNGYILRYGKTAASMCVTGSGFGAAPGWPGPGRGLPPTTATCDGVVPPGAIPGAAREGTVSDDPTPLDWRMPS